MQTFKTAEHNKTQTSRSTTAGKSPLRQQYAPELRHTLHSILYPESSPYTSLSHSQQDNVQQSLANISFAPQSAYSTKGNNRAYAHGKTIHIPQTTFSNSKELRRILHHEVGHVVQQQRENIPDRLAASAHPLAQHRQLEQEAENLGKEVLRGDRILDSTRVDASLTQYDEEDDIWEKICTTSSTINSLVNQVLTAAELTPKYAKNTLVKTGGTVTGVLGIGFGVHQGITGKTQEERVMGYLDAAVSGASTLINHRAAQVLGLSYSVTRTVDQASGGALSDAGNEAIKEAVDSTANIGGNRDKSQRVERRNFETYYGWLLEKTETQRKTIMDKIETISTWQNALLALADKNPELKFTLPEDLDQLTELKSHFQEAADTSLADLPNFTRGFTDQARSESLQETIRMLEGNLQARDQMLLLLTELEAEMETLYHDAALKTNTVLQNEGGPENFTIY